MFVGPTEATFRPRINKASKKLTATMDPLPVRQLSEQRKREDRIAHLAEEVEAQRRQHETFAPKLSRPPPNMNFSQRVPLAERTNHVVESTVPQVGAKASQRGVQPSPQRHTTSTPKPTTTVNTMSTRTANAREVSIDGATQRRERSNSVPIVHTMHSQQQHTQRQMVESSPEPTYQSRVPVEELRDERRQAQQLWARFSDGEHCMTRVGALKAFHSLHIPNLTESTFAKFQTALGIDEASGAFFVGYDRFQRVIQAVLRAAHVQAQQWPSPSSSSHNGNHHNYHPMEGDGITPPRQSFSNRNSVAEESAASPQSRASYFRRSPSAPSPPSAAASTWQDVVDPVTTPLASNRSAPKQQHINNHMTHSPSSSAAPQRTISLSDHRSKRSVPAAEPKPIERKRTPSRSGSVQPRIIPRNNNNPTDASPRQARPKSMESEEERLQRLARPALSRESKEQLHRLQVELKGREMEQCTFKPNTAAMHHGFVRRSFSRSVSQTTPSSSRPVSSDGRRDALKSASPQQSKPQHVDPQPRFFQQNAGRFDTKPLTTDTSPYRDDYNAAARRPSQSPQPRHPMSMDEHHRHGSVGERSVSPSSTVVDGVLGPAPKGFDKAIERMAEGRRRHHPRFEDSLRTSQRQGSSGETMHTEDGTGSIATTATTTTATPFQFRTDNRLKEREFSKPILFIDVDLPNGRTGRIGVHRDDKPEVLARNFCISYGLHHEETIGKLTDVVRSKMDLVNRQATRSMWM